MADDYNANEPLINPMNEILKKHVKDKEIIPKIVDELNELFKSDLNVKKNPEIGNPWWFIYISIAFMILSIVAIIIFDQFEEWTPYHIISVMMSIIGIGCMSNLLLLIKMAPFRFNIAAWPFNSEYQTNDKLLNAMFYVIKWTKIDINSAVLSISDYCSVRGATVQSLLTAFLNIFASFGVAAGIFKLFEVESDSTQFIAVFCLMCGLIGCILLGNFEVNNKTADFKCTRTVKAAIHFAGCFAMMFFTPFGYCLYSDWNILSILLFVGSMGSFIVYVIIRGLAACGVIPVYWPIPPRPNNFKALCKKICDDPPSVNWHKYEKIELLTNSQEKARKRTSYLFCITEGFAILFSGLAAVVFIYEM